MKVILLEKVGRRGRLGDQVIVKKGFARNYLFPTGKAVPATPANLEKFEERRAELEQTAASLIEGAQERKAAVEVLQIQIGMKAGDEGRLFGSVGPQDLVAAAEAQGVEIKRSQIRMPDGPIRNIGEFEIVVHIHEDINATLKVSIVAEG